MESYGNEIKVQQGEAWTLDQLLSASNREYIPFIVSSKRTHPYFVITVASTKYEKNYRYVKSWWCSIEKSHIPTFYHTQPVAYGDLEEGINPADLPTAPGPDSTRDDSKQTRYLYYYTVGDDYTPQYVLDTPEVNWHKPYYYFYFEYDEQGNCIGRVDGYDCHVRMSFLSKDTSEWGSQNYLYQITLVSGQTMAEKLDEIYTYYVAIGETPEGWPTIEPGMTPKQIAETRQAQYKYVKVNYPDVLQPDIDIDSPLGYIEMPETILQPTKLEVFNNLRRLI